MKTLMSLAAALLLAGPAQAKVTRLEITSKQPYGSFRAGDYQRWDGTVHGERASRTWRRPGALPAAWSNTPPR